MGPQKGCQVGPQEGCQVGPQEGGSKGVANQHSHGYVYALQEWGECKWDYLAGFQCEGWGPPGLCHKPPSLHHLLRGTVQGVPHKSTMGTALC